MSEPKKIAAFLVDSKKSPPERAKMLVMHCLATGSDPGAMEKSFTGLFEELDNLTKDATPKAMELKKQYEQALFELAEGPVRPATFIKWHDEDIVGLKPRAHVITPDGQERYPTLKPDILQQQLTSGMTVFLDPKGVVVLGFNPSMPRVGHEAEYLRRLPETNEIEVKYHQEKLTLHASQKILEADEEGTLTRGDSVILCPNRQYAFHAVPADKDRSHRFVDNSKIPNIDIARDVGSPHWCLGWLLRRARLMMFRRDLLDRYCIRPRVSLMMIGGPGTGKTFTIKAYLKTFSDMVEQFTGRGDIGSRTVRVKMSELLSEWLGVSDKNVEHLFDDISALGAELVELPDGSKIRLPVNVIIEEVDGMGPRRSGDCSDGAGGAFDRITTTILQRFDDPIDELGHLPIVFISTSNKPSAIDAGMFRRIAGGQVARFNRLDISAMAAILKKKIVSGYPLANQNGHPHEVARDQMVQQVISCFDADDDTDSGLLQITMRDGKTLKKHHRHFMTPAIIEQAMSTASDELAFAAEESGEHGQALSAGLLIDCLCRHVEAMADVVTPHNVEDFLDLPEHSMVADVRLVRSPRPVLADMVEE
jgi:ATP-dependent 26S proteasome regulatory subunit